MSPHKKVVFSWNLLRYSYGVVLVLAGLDKLFGTDLIVEWAKYLSPAVVDALPISAGMFLAAIGVVEILVGLMLVTKWPKLGGYLSVAWLLLISVDLLMLGYVDIAIRDVLLAVGALVIVKLSKVVDEGKAPVVAS